MSDPNQADPNQQPVSSPPTTGDSSSVPDFQSTDSPVAAPTTTPTPADGTPPMSDINTSSVPPVVAYSPKKKFGGGRIVATILGFLLLVGGIAGGVVLTQQQQDIRERAREAEGTCSSQSDCSPGFGCDNGVCISHPNYSYSQSGYYHYSQSTYATTTCPSGQTKCGTTCVNTQTSGTNCGGCGNSCPTGKTCSAGLCVTTQSGGDCSACGGLSSNRCHCTGGNDCTGHECVTDEFITNVCTSQGRSWCDNAYGSGKTCCAKGYHCATTMDGCAPDTPGGGYSYSQSSYTTNTPVASCQDVKAYSSTWAALTSAQLSQSKVGDQINFCVRGTATQGAFDRAKFTINGVAMAETTTQRPSSTDYCQSYTIPAATTSFTVGALVHHATLGWR